MVDCKGVVWGVMVYVGWGINEIVCSEIVLYVELFVLCWFFVFDCVFEFWGVWICSKIGNRGGSVFVGDECGFWVWSIGSEGYF